MHRCMVMMNSTNFYAICEGHIMNTHGFTIHFCLWSLCKVMICVWESFIMNGSRYGFRQLKYNQKQNSRVNAISKTNVT